MQKKEELLFHKNCNNSPFNELLNYMKKKGKNFFLISIGKSREQLIEINGNFNFIIR